jgi:hypothetical protein
VTVTRGIRNNNPGNLRNVSGTVWQNDTDAYVNAVCKACAASPNNPYTLTPSRLGALAKAIIHQENGEQPYPDAVIEAGVDSAFL